MVLKASNFNTVKNENRALLLNEIRKQPISRIDLSQKVNMSKSAVTTIVNQLIAENQVFEFGVDASCQGRGRKAILLQLNERYRYAIGVCLTRKFVRVSINNLASKLVAQKDSLLSAFTCVAEVIDFIEKSVHALLAENQIDPSLIVGMGVSSPGPLNYRTGEILNPPNLDMFHFVPIVPMLKERFDMPVFLDNSAVLLANLEKLYGGFDNSRCGLFILVIDSLDAGIVADGQIHRGSGGFGGELGHMSIDLNGESCACGNRGCMELYVTAKSLQKKFGFPDYRAVIDSAYHGDPLGLQVVEYQARHMAAGLINVVNLFDIDTVVLYGDLNYHADMLLERLEQMLNSQSAVGAAHKIIVKGSSMPHVNDVITSATGILLDRYFNQTL